MPLCHGNTAEHCCSFWGVICPYVEENTVPGRRWACGLLRELGTWAQVERDPRYIRDVQPHLDKLSALMRREVSCRLWPLPGCRCECTDDNS
jgi:hypothetical protein